VSAAASVMNAAPLRRQCTLLTRFYNQPGTSSSKKQCKYQRFSILLSEQKFPANSAMSTNQTCLPIITCRFYFRLIVVKTSEERALACHPSRRSLCFPRWHVNEREQARRSQSRKWIPFPGKLKPLFSRDCDRCRVLQRSVLMNRAYLLPRRIMTSSFCVFLIIFC